MDSEKSESVQNEKVDKIVTSRFNKHEERATNNNVVVIANKIKLHDIL